MAYLLRTHVKKKYLSYALCAVYGIDKALSSQICLSLGFQKNFLIKNLSNEQIYSLGQYVEEKDIPVKGDLLRWVKQRIDTLVCLRVFRGVRHRLGLPLRGQRTHTNARTAKKLRRSKRK
jgi:small subunit ribosomal protein S13